MEINNKILRRILFILCVAVLLIWAIFMPESAAKVLSRLMAIFSPLIVGGIIAFIVNVPMRVFEARLFKRHFL